MEIIMSQITENNDQIIVKPGKDVVASMANEFRDKLQEQIKKSPKELIIDLQGVEMVDSVGIGVLIATHNSLHKVGGELRVTNVARDIFGLFTTMRLDRHFTVESAGDEESSEQN